MTSGERRPTFLFGPRSTKGIVLGLNAPRLVALAAGLVAVVASMVVTSSLLIGFVPAAVVSLYVWLPVSGRSLAEWAPVTGRFLAALTLRSVIWTAPPDHTAVPVIRPAGSPVVGGDGVRDPGPPPHPGSSGQPTGRGRRHRRDGQPAGGSIRPLLRPHTGQGSRANGRVDNDRSTGPTGRPVDHSAPPGPASPPSAPAVAAHLPDTELANTGLSDTGLSDTGLSDTGLSDTGLRETAPFDPLSPWPNLDDETSGTLGVSGSVVEALGPTVTDTDTRRATDDPATAPAATRRTRRRSAVPSPDRPRRHRPPALPPEWGAPGRWLDVVAGGHTVGLIDQRRSAARTITTTVAVSGKPLSLLSRGEQFSRASAWGQVIAGLAYPGSSIRRLQVIERASPDVGQGQRDWLERTATTHDPTVRQVYEQALDLTGRISAAHTVTLSVQCAIRRGDQAAGIRDALAELDALTGNLRTAGFTARPLSAAEIAAAVRATVDPPSGAAMARRASTGRLSSPPESSGPTGRHEQWRTVRTDDALHAVFVVAQYPRQEVYADWLRRLLLETVPGAVRTVSFLLEPVAPEAARRAAEQEVMGQEGTNEQRAKLHFRVAASARRQATMALAREEELADGHQLVRFAGLVGISARTQAELDRATRQIDAAAGQSHLDLRRLYGQQAQALVGLTPLARWRVQRRWE